MYYLLSLALILRLVLFNQSLWLDESIQALALMGKMGPLLTYALADFQPPLYHFVLWAWTWVWGYSEIALRTPSLLAGLATVYFTAKIGQFYGGTKLMYLSGLLVATNPLLIYYSQEGRTYALTTFLVTASFYYLILLLKKKEKHLYLLYTIFTVLFVWTSYLAWYALLAQAIYVLYLKRYDIFKLQLLSGFTLLLWLPSFLTSLSIGSSTLNTSQEWGRVVGGINWKSIPLTWVKFALGRVGFANSYLYASIVVALFSLHAFALTRLKFKQYSLLLTWLTLPLIFGLITALFLPVYQYFRVLFVLPAYLLLLGFALSRFQTKYLSALLLGAQLLSLAYFWQTPRFHKEDWRALVADLNPGEVVAMPSRAQSAPLLYYGWQDPILEPAHTTLSGSPIIYIRYVEDLFDTSKQGQANFASSLYTITSQRVYPGIQLDVYEKAQ